MIHDFWKPYYSNEAARHGLCNAHILRDLVYAEEEKHQVWAKQMQELLLEILGSRKQYAAMGQTSFQEGVLEAYLLRYDRIVADGFGQKMPISGSVSCTQFTAIYHFSTMTLLCHSENHFLNASLRHAGQKIQATFIKVLAKFFTGCYTISHKAHLFGLCGWWSFLIVPY